MKKYMEDWNEIVDLIEGITNDILDNIASYEDESEAYREISYSIAVYSLMLLKNYSL